MNFSFYIARRYLISKKSHNIINIISAISITGVAIGTMALIIVLSVFNGFDNLVVSLFSSFNPDFEVTAAKGKTFVPDSAAMKSLRSTPGILHITEVIEENALMLYKDKQCIVTVKGVSEEYSGMHGLDSMMIEGKFLLQDADQNFTVLGIGVASTLGASLTDYLTPITVYVPRRDASPSTALDQAFNSEVIFPSGFFQIQWEYDVKYALVPLRFARTLFQYTNERTSLEIGTAKNTDRQALQKKITTLLGPGFIVRNRYQQQEILYQIMVSEKNYIFMILTLILIIATFNVIGTLSMLILDKKKDIAVLQSLGASRRTIRKIFLAEGMLISLIGAIAGLAVGALVCYLQIRFQLVKLGNEGSSFVVNAYPVYMKVTDFLAVFITVMTVGLLAAWYPVHNIKKIHLSEVKLD